MPSLSFPLDVGGGANYGNLYACMWERIFISFFFFFREIQGPRKATELAGRPLAEGEGGGAALVPSFMSLLSAWA